MLGGIGNKCRLARCTQEWHEKGIQPHLSPTSHSAPIASIFTISTSVAKKSRKSISTSVPMALSVCLGGLIQRKCGKTTGLGTLSLRSDRAGPIT
jgi:hypothetical protein